MPEMGNMMPPKDFGPEVVRSEMPELLFLAAVAPLGLLAWVAIFFTIQWSVLALWVAARVLFA
jgi:hypothetical protein